MTPWTIQTAYRHDIAAECGDGRQPARAAAWTRDDAACARVRASVGQDLPKRTASNATTSLTSRADDSPVRTSTPPWRPCCGLLLSVQAACVRHLRAENKYNTTSRNDHMLCPQARVPSSPSCSRPLCRTIKLTNAGMSRKACSFTLRKRRIRCVLCAASIVPSRTPEIPILFFGAVGSHVLACASTSEVPKPHISPRLCCIHTHASHRRTAVKERRTSYARYATEDGPEASQPKLESVTPCWK